MTLFDSVREEHTAPKQNAESSFAYLNCSTRPEIQNIREVCEAWYACYPVSDKIEVRARFQDSSETNHNSAFFELFLHALLVHLGCQVSCHPETPNVTTKRPDFLVTPPTGSQFYLEAVVVTGKTKEDKAAEARMEQVYDALNRMNSPNFFLHLRVRGAPANPPPGKQLRQKLERYLASIDPEQVANLRETYDYEASEHVYHYNEDGWTIDFYPIPKSPELRGKTGVRPVGRRTDEAKFMRLDDALRVALIEKARRYGKLELPLIVAVNALDLSFDDIDYQQALLGTEQLYHNAAGELRMERAPDGVFLDEYGPRLSAVLFFHNLLPYNFPRSEVLLVHNKFAAIPLPFSNLARLHQEGYNLNVPGEVLSTIFGVSSSWPSVISSTT